jgi:hypothetical protein
VGFGHGLLVVLAGCLPPQVKILATGAKQGLTASWTTSVNGLDTTSGIVDSHLRYTPDGYVVSLLGKTGEPVADQALR